MIPRKIHQVWHGGRVPAVWADLARTWQHFHPDWQYHLWSDADSRPFVEARFPEYLGAYDSYAYLIQRADALRYLLLYWFGGVYLDMDVECLRPIDQLLAGQRALVVQEPPAHALERGVPVYLSNAFIAAEPGHPMLGELVQLLAGESAVAVTHRDVLELTGPFKLDRVFRTGAYADVGVLDHFVVCPLARETPELRKLLEHSDEAVSLKRSYRVRGAYAIHHWANSWFNLSGEDLVNPAPYDVAGFVFFSRRDSPGHDVRHAGRNVPELARACLACESAVAFNTDGFLKSRLRPRRRWDRWLDRAENEGLYIKKSALRWSRWPVAGER